MLTTFFQKKQVNKKRISIFFTDPHVCFENVHKVLITSYHFKHLSPGHCPLCSSRYFVKGSRTPVVSCQTNFLRLFLNKTPVAHLKWNTTTSSPAPKLKIVHLGTPVCPTTHKHGPSPLPRWFMLCFLSKQHGILALWRGPETGLKEARKVWTWIFPGGRGDVRHHVRKWFPANCLLVLLCFFVWIIFQINSDPFAAALRIISHDYWKAIDELLKGLVA